MRYKSFRIQNFKGIKDTTVDLLGAGTASVFAFVGLNESGKTTILEAIHSFAPDEATNELLGGDDEAVGVPVKDRVPRHLISSFSGDVSVEATLSLTGEDRSNLVQDLADTLNLRVEPATFPSEVTFSRVQRFRGGDFQKSYFDMKTELKVRGPKQKRWRDPLPAERIKIRDLVWSYVPDIAYFPTFVFDFPESIFLTDRGNEVDRFYRSVFQDILDYDGKGHTIEDDIIRRVRAKGMVAPWLAFLSAWTEHDDQAKIQHVMDRASAAATRLVFGRWNRIFGEDTRDKEVVISYEVMEGEREDARGVLTKTEEHDVRIRFRIKDGTRRFNVNDRSLGFRWFFAFMLFTQFRVARAEAQPLLFLFDEPASNLHAAAQQKLIECFPEVAQGEHTLAYSTHSHYMIEPKWLEQTFIVTNRADAPLVSVLDGISLDDESLDIKATTYRKFVDQHPTQISYFQPILDRLQVVPSRFDFREASVVVEGKSDYYVLRYVIRLLGRTELPLIPGVGAGTFGALAALHAGWNLNFLFLLDGDGQGKSERKRYASEFGVPLDRLVTIDQMAPELAVIEDLLDVTALEFVRKELQLSEAPSKGQIRRFFQERLAAGSVVELGPAFRQRATALLDGIESRLAT